MAPEPLLAIVGPTTSGKTLAAIAIAARLEAEIVSVDSMLVYRGMDVGTAKPSPAEMAGVPHHLIDVAEPSESFSVARYQTLGTAVLRETAARGRPVLLAGGSGLYYRALVDDLEFPGTDPDTRELLEGEAGIVGADAMYMRLAELDPVGAAKIEPANVRRTIRALEVAAITGRRFSSFATAWERYPDGHVRAAGLAIPREVLDTRARSRVFAMLEAGLLGEVRGLLERGFGGWFTSSQAIGYAEFALHLQGQLSLEDAVERTVRRTKNLARRQEAWFRRDPRIRWFEAETPGGSDVIDAVCAYLGSVLETA
ncbi:MAG: tRNA (adenosine(37)-N6)-dimethylallyltransferase MiaA [Actinomycetota bacterium]|nr:tRNA (adenosine(37)-N6)-dimethylallyltransferase MiaA [Actinomycetota bacterium]